MAIFGKLFGRVLYYPGCSSKFVNKDIQRRHEHLLTTFDIEFVKLPDIEVCCGLPALKMGYRDDFQSLVNKNTEMFKNQKIKMIITSCPSCYRIFKKHYNIEVKHITEVILENLDKLKKEHKNEEVVFFDPCNPDRIEELYENPREILARLGFKVVELGRNRRESLCCGFPLKENSPKVANAMAQSVLKGASKVVTTCPNCYSHLKSSCENVEVMELSEVLI